MVKNGDEQVSEDDQRERAQLENEEQDNSHQQNQKAGNVHSGELEILELQRNHIDRADQQISKKEGEKEHHPIIVKDGNILRTCRNETQK